MSEQLSENLLRGNRFLGSNKPDASGLLEELLQTATAANSSDRAKARGTLESALSLLMTSRDAHKFPRPGSRGGLAPWQVKRVAAYISEHIGSRLQASDLAAVVGYSYSHFNRAFRVSFQETPVAYIMRQRMNLAREKMLTTGHSLSHVARECGLYDQAHFNRMFRRIVGQTPRLWRRQFAPGLTPNPR
jgi:AraC-like DNA-binding protein